MGRGRVSGLSPRGSLCLCLEGERREPSNKAQAGPRRARLLPAKRTVFSLHGIRTGRSHMIQETECSPERQAQ